MYIYIHTYVHIYIYRYINTYKGTHIRIEVHIYIYGLGSRAATPPQPPCFGDPFLGPLPGLSTTTVTGIELVGATILVTVLVFGGWDRHRDVKPPIVASPDSRKFSTCRATCHLEYGISSWHDIVLCMVVFGFCGGRLQNKVGTGTEPTTQTTVRSCRVSMQCSASAPE